MKGWKALAAAMIAAVWAAPAPTPAPGAAIVFLDSRPEYTDALNGFKEVFSGPLKIYTSAPLPAEFAEDVVIAFGSKSADEVTPMSEKKPTVLSMVLDVPNPLRFHVSGVRLLVDPGDVMKTIKEILPGIKKVGVFSMPESSKDYLAAAEKAAKESRLELVRIEITNDREILSKYLQNVGKIDVLWLIPDLMIGKGELVPILLERSLRNSVPVVGSNPAFTKRGALFSLSPDFREVGRQTALITLEVMAGKKPGVQSPAKPALSINTRVADVLRIRFPKSVTDRAVKDSQ